MSNDLISRSALLRQWWGMDGKKFPLHDCDNFPMQVNLEDVQQSIRNAPTVDAVEVVRCGQCDLSKTCAYRLRSGFKSNDFCSYGERKDGAEGQREMTNSEALECFESDCETCQFKGDDCKSCRTKVAISALRAQDKELRRFFLARETHGIY